jgi:hypothetical protein
MAGWQLDPESYKVSKRQRAPRRGEAGESRDGRNEVSIDVEVAAYVCFADANVQRWAEHAAERATRVEHECERRRTIGGEHSSVPEADSKPPRHRKDPVEQRSRDPFSAIADGRNRDTRHSASLSVSPFRQP